MRLSARMRSDTEKLSTMALGLLKTFFYKKALERKHATTEKSEAKTMSSIFNLKVVFGEEENLCRICCNEGDIPIFSELSDKTIADHINVCSEITVSSSDGFPKWICGSCYKLLNNAIKLRELSRCSTTKLIKIKMDQAGDNTTPYFEPTKVPIKNETTDPDCDPTTSPLRSTSRLAAGAADDPPSPLNGADDWGGWDSVIPSCEMCGGDFRDINEYRNHLSSCNLTLLRTDESKSIQEVFNRKKRKKIPKGPFLCEVCGKSLGKLHSLAVHRTTHRNIFPFKCDQCPYRGRTKDLLKVHLRTHLAVRPFACPNCPLRFTTASNLGKHRLRHEEQKPQECQRCGKTFSNKLSLARHVTDIHIGSPPVHCELCGKRFTRQKNLHNHRLKAHNIKTERTGRLPSYLLCNPEDEPDDLCDPPPPVYIQQMQ